MGFIDKIYKVSQTANNFANVAKIVGDGKSLLGGFDINSLGINNLSSISSFDMSKLTSVGGGIESNLKSMASELTEDVTSSFDMGEIENIASSITPEDVGIDMKDLDISSELNGLDLNSLGIGNIDINSLGLNGLSFM